MLFVALILKLLVWVFARVILRNRGNSASGLNQGEQSIAQSQVQLRQDGAFEKTTDGKISSEDDGRSVPKIKSLPEKINGFFSFGFFVILLEALHLDILVPAFVNISSLKFANFYGSFNNMLSLGVVLTSSVFCCIIVRVSFQIEKIRCDESLSVHERRQRMEVRGLNKWSFLKQELKQKRSLV